MSAAMRTKAFKSEDEEEDGFLSLEIPMACFQNPILGENRNVQLRAGGGLCRTGHYCARGVRVPQAF